MLTQGINAVYHDSAACLVKDGQVVAAGEEERFRRVKYARRPVPFSTCEPPFHAIDYCLHEAGIRLTDVDHVAYSYDPYLLLGALRGDATITLPLEPNAQPTPFNTRGEPIVCTPRDAVERYWTSPLDALVIGPFLPEKRPIGAG